MLEAIQRPFAVYFNKDISTLTRGMFCAMLGDWLSGIFLKWLKLRDVWLCCEIFVWVGHWRILAGGCLVGDGDAEAGDTDWLLAGTVPATARLQTTESHWPGHHCHHFICLKNIKYAGRVLFGSPKQRAVKQVCVFWSSSLAFSHYSWQCRQDSGAYTIDLLIYLLTYIIGPWALDLVLSLTSWSHGFI